MEEWIRCFLNSRLWARLRAGYACRCSQEDRREMTICDKDQEWAQGSQKPGRNGVPGSGWGEGLLTGASVQRL